MQLNDKVVLVTGASMGIGLQIARALVREGCRVAFAARSYERLAAEVANQPVGRAVAVRLDVTDGASVAEAIAAVEAAFGRLDVVVNNAGNGGGMRRWQASDAAATAAMFEVHVLGAERVMRAALPLMLRGGGGTIVNFSSTLGYVAMPGTAAYNAAKAAVVMLSQTLRAELQPLGVDVRIFAPPHTSTDSGNEMPLNLPKIFAPDWVAHQFVRFLRGRRAQALPGGNGSLLALQRLSPWLASRIMQGIGFGALQRAERLALPGPRSDRHEG